MASFENDITYERFAKHCRNQGEPLNRLHGLTATRDVITGRLTLLEVYESLVAGLGLTLDYAAFERAWLEPYTAPMPGMAEVVQALAPHYQLLLLSNVDCYYWGTIQAGHPELECFDHILLSCKLGMAKPDRAIFLHASQVAKVEPADCFFVDDTPDNVEAARAAGLQAYCFQGVAELLNELKKRKIKGINDG